MAWSVSRLLHGRRDAAMATAPPEPAPSGTDIDELLACFRDVWVSVPCAGCGGAHEMSCAELLARQLTRGTGWASEECDDGALLRAILSPEEAAACRDDPEALCAVLGRKGLVTSRGAAPPSAAPAVHHIMQSY